MTHYYDFVLGLIPLVLAGLSGGLFALGLTPTTALQIAGVATIGVIAHALFVRAPVSRPEAPAARESPSNVPHSAD